MVSVVYEPITGRDRPWFLPKPILADWQIRTRLEVRQTIRSASWAFGSSQLGITTAPRDVGDVSLIKLKGSISDHETLRKV